MKKEWMNGPFLDISHYVDNTPTTITIYPELFEQLFAPEDRYSAFYTYYTEYRSEMHTHKDVQDILENFTRCSSCEDWCDKDDLIDTEEMINGGVGYICASCVDSL
jgi:hypothetical protein